MCARSILRFVFFLVFAFRMRSELIFMILKTNVGICCLNCGKNCFPLRCLLMRLGLSLDVTSSASSSSAEMDLKTARVFVCLSFENCLIVIV